LCDRDNYLLELIRYGLNDELLEMFAESGAASDGIAPSLVSNYVLRIDWQFGLYQLHKPLSFFSGKTFDIAADRRGDCRI
jgi:hypothetical protein